MQGRRRRCQIGHIQPGCDRISNAGGRNAVYRKGYRSGSSALLRRAKASERKESESAEKNGSSDNVGPGKGSGEKTTECGRVRICAQGKQRKHGCTASQIS